MSERREEIIRPNQGGVGQSPVNSGGIRELAKLLLPAVAVGLLLWGVLIPSMLSSYVKKTDEAAHIQGLTTSIGTLTNRVTGSETTITTISAQITSLGQDIANAKNTFTTTDKVNGLVANQINPLQQSLNSLKVTVDGLPKSQPDIAPLKTQLASLQTELDSLKSDVAKLSTTTTPVTALPTITSFTPASGTQGTSVVITGTNFNATSAVSFGGVTATFTINSATQITATLGSGASGYVTVTTPAGTATSQTSFTYTGTSGGGTGAVSSTIVGSATLSLASATGNTVNISIFNASGKAIYAEQVSLTLQFLNPPSAISGWGITLTGSTGVTIGSPSYSIVPGIVSYIVSASEYITNGASQTISVTIATPNLATYPVNFLTTVSTTGFSALP